MAGLPEGLVTNSETITSTIESIHHVAVEDVITLWKAYSANRSLLADGAGRRLENFFWRIWGNRDILNTITGSQLAVLFDAISQEGPLRTTPTQSPRASRHIGSYIRTAQPSHSQAQAENRSSLAVHQETVVPPDTSESHEKEADIERSQVLAQTERVEVSPHEQSSGYGDTSAEAAQCKIITEDDGDDDTPTATPPATACSLVPLAPSSPAIRAPDTLLRPSALRADSETLPPRSTELSESASSEDTVDEDQPSVKKPGRKRTTFYASTPTNRRRPVVMRRKSSQISSNTASSTTSLHPSVSSISEAKTAETLQRQQESSSENSERHPGAVAGSMSRPANAIQDPRGTSARLAPRSDQNASQRQQAGTLVEPDFRSKFVAKTRSAQPSFVSLPSLLRTPSATTATSASYQASGTMDTGNYTQPEGRRKARVTFSDDVATSGPANLADSATENDPGAQALPRTKSQLSLLLERNRRRGNGDQKEDKPPKKPSR